MATMATTITKLKNALKEDGFLHGHLRFFGIMQILLGIVQVTGGVALAVAVPYSSAVKTATPWWTGVASVISGAATVHCADKPTEEFKKTTLVINAIHITSTVIACCIYGISTSFSSMFISNFLPITPMTLTWVLASFCVWNLFMTVPVCLVYYKHHPRVRRHMPH